MFRLKSPETNAKPHFGWKSGLLLLSTLSLFAVSCAPQTTVSSEALPIDRGQVSLNCNGPLGNQATYSHTFENLQPQDVVWIQKRQDLLEREHGVKLEYNDQKNIDFTYTPNFNLLWNLSPNADVDRVPGTTNSYQIKKYDSMTGDTIFTATLETKNEMVNLALVGTCVQ